MRRSRRTAQDNIATFEQADAELAQTLDNLDDAEHYRQWIYELMAPYLGDHILEVGAGHGTFTALLARGRHVTASDLSVRCVDALHERYDDNPAVAVLHGDLAAASGRFDTVVLVNVLEHIADDTEALDQIRHLLLPGGRVVLWVPAFEQLYSEFDQRIGHHRRYTEEGLRRRIVSCGFTLDEIRYVNALGAIAWWLVAKALRRTPTGKLGVKIYDRVFVPAVRRVEERWRPPFGQSILAIASRAGDSVQL